VNTLPPKLELEEPPSAPRLDSLDAYRGFIMLTLATAGLGFSEVAKQKAFAGSGVWQFLGREFSHVAWVGCSFWDLIQPAFMFMVGLSMAYSYASRGARGQSYLRMLGHAAYRALVLVLLGVLIYSQSDKLKQTNWVFKNVLAQIGLGYFFLFLLWNRPRWAQAVAAGGILLGYWILFVVTPLPPENELKYLTGFAGHWDIQGNAAAKFDLWFLNLFPRSDEFKGDGGGYQTLSFVPSLATMIFGLMTGELLRGSRTPKEKLIWLIGGGVAGLAAGWLLDATGICPLVKRIWTPSFCLYSTGWVLLMLAAFYGIIDVWGKKGWSWPLKIVGMNSLAIYLMEELLRPWFAKQLRINFGPEVFTLGERIDPAYSIVVERVLVALCLWLVCLWMYRQKIFVKI
jgi:heparan-alpha-glucosaminide N-acetyltransferase